MNNRKKVLVLSIWIIAPFGKLAGQVVAGQKDTLTLSLNEVWTKAEAFSRKVEISRQEVAVRKENYADAKMERYPDIGIKGTAEKATNIPIYDHGLFHTPSQHDVIHNLYRVSSDFYLNIYNGNKLNLKIREDRTLHELALIEKDQTIAEVRYESAQLYLDLQKSFIFLDLVQKDILDQEKQLEEIRSLYKNGVILKSDVLRVELDLSKRKMLEVEIRNDILIATQKLNILIGEPDDRIILPTGLANLSLNHLESYEACLQQALSHSFDYQVSEEMTKLSALHLKQVQANVRPQIGLYGEYYFMNPQIFLYPYNPYWYSLGIAGLRVSFPVSSLYHNIHKKRGAQMELEKEEEAHKETEDLVRQQVREAYLRYEEALVRIQVSEVNVAQAMENARIIKETYFKQTSLVTDLLDADIQVLQTRFELEAAKMEAQTKYYFLKNVIGTI
ncbi:TolC family protein [Fluviicola sp.]|uniref:TolC family protein n=1 Tax=Fluviicola sp. TaxID=1917219 RepID=UPI0031DF17F9